MGNTVLARQGWCTHSVIGSGNKDVRILDASIPTDKASLALGVLGMPG